MKRNKSLSLVLCAVLLFGGVASGCSSESKDVGGSTQSSKTVSTPSVQKKIKIEMMLSDGGVKIPSDEENFIKKELDKSQNIDLVMTTVGAEYANQLNVRISSGNFPDMFQIPSRPLFGQYVDNGVALEITPYLNKLEEVTTFLGDDMKWGIYNGKNYAIPKASGVSYAGGFIRQDWLNKLGLEAPKNADELIKVAKAFTENDPDGNSKKDTYGISSGDFPVFADAILAGYNSSVSNEIVVKDNKVQSLLYSPMMKDGLTMVKKVIDAGVTDPDMLTNGDPVLRDKCLQGKVGITPGWAWSGIMKEEFLKQAKEINPNAEWAWYEPMTGPAGKFQGIFSKGRNALTAISKNVEKDPDKLQRIFDLLNYISSEKGNRTVAYGIEGTHYNIKDNKVVSTELMAKEAGYIWIYQFTGRPEKEYLKTKFASCSDVIDKCSNAPVIETYTKFILPPEGFNVADLNKYISEEMPKFVYGKRKISDYDNFLKKLEDTYKINTYLDAATTQLKGIGVIK